MSTRSALSNCHVCLLEGNKTQRDGDSYIKTMKVSDIQNKKKWPKNTILITGDSILNNIEKSTLRKKFNVKVRAFLGADVKYMYDYLPLLRKGPKHVVLHKISTAEC